MSISRKVEKQSDSSYVSSRIREGTDHNHQSNPSPVGKRAIGLMAQWRQQEGMAGTATPPEIQKEAWDIARHPTELKPLLSRKGKSKGMNLVVTRTPSFLKKTK